MITLSFFNQYSRKDFVSFKKRYRDILRDLYEHLEVNCLNTFLLCRITNDSLIKETVTYLVKDRDETGFTVLVPSTIEDGPAFFEKYIRHDNILSDFPLPIEYQEYTPVEFGTHKHVYLRFKNVLITKMKQYVGLKRSLYYLNDDGTHTIIDCVIKEVNRSNFLCEDFSIREIDIDGKCVSQKQLNKTTNHRFISQNGFLYQVGPSQISPYVYDDGEVFGEASLFLEST